ncbi:MAG: 50S ribosomal protein L10 [Candidatus Omnitrophica bacterium]|nr:50S ribosomal protein L10 [Candidatus Omnitrophota bacterium]
MKSLGLVVREQIVGEIKEKADGANACFFINFNKVKASSLSAVRNDLRKAGARVFVAKNSLFEKAFNDLGFDETATLLGKETGVIFVRDEDVVGACKTLVDFAKENERLEIKGGFLKSKKVDSKEMTALAKLPSKEVLLAQALGGIASPLTGFMAAMNQVILKFVWTVEEIKKKKD